MGQANLPPAPAASAETGELETSKTRTPLSFKERVGAIVAVGVATATLAWAGVRTKEYIDANSTPVAYGDLTAKLSYTPAGEVDDSGATSEATEKNMVAQYYTEGHDTGLLQPDDGARKFYRKTFSNPQVGISKHIPPLTEMAHMQDENIFKPEYKNHLYTYPVTILNNTEHPIDLMYLNYAIRATKSWLNEEVQDGSGFVIGGHTQTKVEPLGVPHTLVMTDKIPPGLHKDLPYSDGVTSWDYDSTSSFIKDSGPDRYPFLPSTVGTEVCQALVNVYGEKTMPGHKNQQKDMQDYIATFNAAAENDLDLATQEYVCNRLGNVVSAAYFGGRTAVEELPTNTDEEDGVKAITLDYRPFKSQIDDFLTIARHIKNGGEMSTLIVTRGDNSPTARLYQRQEKLPAQG